MVAPVTNSPLAIFTAIFLVVASLLFSIKVYGLEQRDESDHLSFTPELVLPIFDRPEWSILDQDMYYLSYKENAQTIDIAYSLNAAVNPDLAALKENKVVSLGMEQIFGYRSIPEVLRNLGSPTALHYEYSPDGAWQIRFSYGVIDLWFADGTDYVAAIEFSQRADHLVLNGFIRPGVTTIHELLEFYPEIRESHEMRDHSWGVGEGAYFESRIEGDGYGFFGARGFDFVIQNNVLAQISFISPEWMDGYRSGVIAIEMNDTEHNRSVYQSSREIAVPEPSWLQDIVHHYHKTVEPPTEEEPYNWIDFVLNSSESADSSKERLIIEAGTEVLFRYTGINAIIQDFGIPDRITIVYEIDGEIDEKDDFFLNLFYGRIQLFYERRIVHTNIDEIRFSDESLPILVNGGLAVGDSIEQVKGFYSHIRDALPEEYINGEQDWRKTGVYFSGLHGGDYGYLNLPNEGIRMFFAHDLITALYLPFPEGTNPGRGTFRWED